MKWTGLGLCGIAIAMFVAWGLNGLFDTHKPQPPFRDSRAYKLENHEGQKPVRPAAVVTVGNHSYLYLGIDGSPADHVPEILQSLDEFENRNKDVEVTSWHLMSRQPTNWPGHVYGIWIDHKHRIDK